MQEMIEGLRGGGQTTSRGTGGGSTLGRQQQARAVCPRCDAENQYTATVGGGVANLQCGSCQQLFGAMMPEPAEGRSTAHTSMHAGSLSGSAIHICRRCGTMNQFPMPAPGAPVPSLQCGSCGNVSQPSVSRIGGRQNVQRRIAEQLLASSDNPGNSPWGSIAPHLLSGPQVGINVNGQQRVVPLALLMALMAEEQSNSASDSDIRALPTRKLQGTTGLGEQRQCLVCLEDFVDGDDVKTLPCLHIYHQKCVERWLHTDNSCPVCKTPIGERASHR